VVIFSERKDLNAYIKEIERTARGLEGATRLQFLGRLDRILSKIRRGVDVETTEGVQGRPDRPAERSKKAER
jgi:hypothetical protein